MRKRRGHTLLELVFTATLTLVVLGGAMSLMTTAGRLQTGVTMETDSTQTATRALNHLVVDAREGKQVTVVSPTRVQIYYPIAAGGGYYDRTRVNSGDYVEYALTDDRGRPRDDGTYLWRSTRTDAGRAVARKVSRFAVSSTTPASLRLSLAVQESTASGTANTTSAEREIFLRNH